MTRNLICVSAILFVSAVFASTPTTDTFDGPGTPYINTQQAGAPPAAGVVGGPSGSFMRMTTNVGNLQNYISYNQTVSGPSSLVTVDFDFRIGSGTRADGMGVLLANTANFGSSGNAAWSIAEEP